MRCFGKAGKMRKKIPKTADGAVVKSLLEDLAYCETVLLRDTLDKVDIAVWEKMKKEKIRQLVELKHPYAICGGKEKALTKEQKKAGVKAKKTRYHTRIEGGKQIYAGSEDELFAKLHQYYYGEVNYTLGELYEPYTEWKKKRKNLVQGSVKRERNIFKKYIRESRLARMKMTRIRASDIEEFMSSFSEQLSRHQLGNIKSVINGIFDYAVSRDIVTINLARQYNTRSIKTIAETNHYNVFSDQDREKILRYLKDSTNIYDLALRFGFQLCCRAGEIRAFHWEDLGEDDNYIIIRREIVLRPDEKGKNHYVEVEHTKTGNDSGVRKQPLNREAKEVLNIIRSVYGKSGTYVFTSKNGKFLYETPLGRHLRSACEGAGVEYRSIHKMRFWMASALADKGASVQDLMSIGGWSTTETAMKYIRMNNAEKRNRELFDAATR